MPPLPPFPKPWTFIQLARRAEQWHKEHNPAELVPVPFEWIIESPERYGFEVVPMPGLLEFRSYGFVSLDLRRLTVDEDVMWKQPFEFQFTLAHDFAHYVLHQDFLNALAFESIDEAKEAYGAIPDKIHDRMETECNWLGAMLLCRPRSLEDQLASRAQNMRARCRRLGDLPGREKKAMLAWLGRHYEIPVEPLNEIIDQLKLWDL